MGAPQHFVLPGGGALDVHIDALSGRPGTEFTVSRSSRLAAIEDVQARMGIFERGRASGVIGVTLEGNDPALTTAVLNEIGAEYVQQREPEGGAGRESLSFLEQQLPQMKKDLDAAETKYNALRNKRGTIDLSEEAKLILAQSVDAQTKVMELRAKRQDLITRFAPTHPSILAIDRQIASLTGDVNRIGNNIKQLPDLEQDVVRLVRDVRVNTELYTALLNNPAAQADSRRQGRQRAHPGRGGAAGQAGAAQGRHHHPGGQRHRPDHWPAVGPGAQRPVRRPVRAGGSGALYRPAGAGGDSLQRHPGQALAPQPPQECDRARAAGAEPEQRAAHRKPAGLPQCAAGLAAPVGQQHGHVHRPRGRGGQVLPVGQLRLHPGRRGQAGAADRRRLPQGQLNRYFGVPKEDGLFEVLSGTIPLEQVRRHSVSEGVDFISTGAVTFDPSELLASPVFGQTLRELSTQYDMVVLDTAPVLSSPDAAVVGSHAAAVMVVVRSGMNTVGEIRETAKRLIQAGAPVDGVLFNGLKLLPERFGLRSKYGGYRYSRAAYYGDFKQNGPK